MRLVEKDFEAVQLKVVNLELKLKIIAINSKFYY
jgi:hypothetical protein